MENLESSIIDQAKQRKRKNDNEVATKAQQQVDADIADIFKDDLEQQDIKNNGINSMIVVASNADTEKQEAKKTKYDLTTSSEYDTKDTIDDKFDQTSKSLIVVTSKVDDIAEEAKKRKINSFRNKKSSQSLLMDDITEEVSKTKNHVVPMEDDKSVKLSHHNSPIANSKSQTSQMSQLKSKESPMASPYNGTKTKLEGQ